MERAETLVARSQNEIARLFVRRQSALLHSAHGRTAAAQKELGALLAEATAAGMVTEEFEIRFAQYRALAAGGGSRQELSDRIRAFAQEATGRGMGLIAHRARGMSQP
jgi:hypothetical protein